MRGKNKLKYSTISIFIISMIIIFFSIAITSYYDNFKLLNLELNNLHSKNAKSFIVEEYTDNEVNLLENIKEFGESEYILYRKNVNSNNKINGIYIDGYKMIPPIIEGKFFTTEQINSQKGFTLVGKNVLESLTNKKEMRLFNDTLEIIGTLGYKNKKSIYDDLILVNLPFIIEKVGLEGTYVYDTSNNDNDFINLITKEINNSSSIKISETNSFELESQFYIPDTSSIDTIAVFLILIIIFTSFSVTLIWINDQKDNIAIKKLIGVGDIRILLDVIGDYLKISIIAASIGVISVIVFNSLSILSVYINLDIIIKSYLLTFASAIAISIPSIYKTLNLEVASLVR